MPKFNYKNNSELKPLLANLFRAGIGQYLMTDFFDHLVVELNLDEEWEFCCNEFGIDKLSTARDYEGPLRGFLNILYEKELFDKEKAFKIVIKIFLAFLHWSPHQIDFRPTYDSLKQYVDKNHLKSFVIDARKISSKKIEQKAVPKLEPGVESKKVFIIHGHDKTALLELEKLLKNEFKLHPVVLQETPGESMDTIFSKFEREAKTCGVAIALFTPDDETKAGKYRPRQNAILELGYFWGRESVQKRIIILKKGDLEIPSNIHGIETIEFVKSVDEVHVKLKRQFHKWKVVIAEKNETL